MLKLDERNLRPGALALARLIGVTNPGIIERAIGAIGLEATVVALLVTGQHSVAGEIRRSPEIYFRGLVKRGRKSDLNLGHSIFGRREAVNLQVLGRSRLSGEQRRKLPAAATVDCVEQQSC